jgi:RNA polymerase sigma-70 factor (ECF subfamily)
MTDAPVRGVFVHIIRAERAPDGMDQSGFDRVFDEYAPRVRAYLVRHGLSRSLADEVVQEVMLTVWHHWDKFDPARGSMATWVFTIARNRLIDSVRRKRRPEPDPTDPCWVGDRDDRAPSPEAVTAQRQRVAALRVAFGTLPAEQRHVLEGLYFEGQSMSEFAEATGVPLGTVKTRARLALRALRGRIAERNDE